MNAPVLTNIAIHQGHPVLLGETNQILTELSQLPGAANLPILAQWPVDGIQRASVLAVADYLTQSWWPLVHLWQVESAQELEAQVVQLQVSNPASIGIQVQIDHMRSTYHAVQHSRLVLLFEAAIFVRLYINQSRVVPQTIVSQISLLLFPSSFPWLLRSVAGIPIDFDDNMKISSRRLRLNECLNPYLPTEPISPNNYPDDSNCVSTLTADPLIPVDLTTSASSLGQLSALMVEPSVGTISPFLRRVVCAFHVGALDKLALEFHYQTPFQPHDTSLESVDVTTQRQTLLFNAFVQAWLVRLPPTAGIDHN